MTTGQALELIDIVIELSPCMYIHKLLDYLVFMNEVFSFVLLSIVCCLLRLFLCYVKYVMNFGALDTSYGTTLLAKLIVGGTKSEKKIQNLQYFLFFTNIIVKCLLVLEL